MAHGLRAVWLNSDSAIWRGDRRPKPADFGATANPLRRPRRAIRTNAGTRNAYGVMRCASPPTLHSLT